MAGWRRRTWGRLRRLSIARWFAIVVAVVPLAVLLVECITATRPAEASAVWYLKPVIVVAALVSLVAMALCWACRGYRNRLVDTVVRHVHEQSHGVRSGMQSALKQRVTAFAARPSRSVAMLDEKPLAEVVRIARGVLRETLAALAAYLEDKHGLKPGSLELMGTIKLTCTGCDIHAHSDLLDGDALQGVEAEENYWYLRTLSRASYPPDPQRERERADDLTHLFFGVFENSAFYHILFSGESSFCFNDLRTVARTGLYQNENSKWSEHYNAVLVVPIRFMKEGNKAPGTNRHARWAEDVRHSLAFGVIGVDSMNPLGLDLFDDKTDRLIVQNAADLLASYLLAVNVGSMAPPPADAAAAGDGDLPPDGDGGPVGDRGPSSPAQTGDPHRRRASADLEPQPVGDRDAEVTP